MANEVVWEANGDNNFFYEESGVGSGTVIFEVGNVSGNTAKGALRFTGINMTGSVNYASLYLYAGAQGGGSGNLKFRTYGIDEDNTADFGGGNPFGRAHTTAFDSADNPLPGVGNYKQVTVTSIVNEILARGGWSSGNAMGFLCEDNSSPSDVYLLDGNTSINSYLAIRKNAEPDFTPTPTTVTAPAIPGTNDFGLKISQPGVSVFTATEAQTYYTSRKKRFKVHTEGQTVTTANPHIITHNLGYIPFFEVFVKSGTSWYRLPFMNFSGGANFGYVEANSTQIKVYVNTSSTIYYYVFLDELNT